MIIHLSRFYEERVLKHPVIVLLLLAGLQVYFSLHISDFRLDASADSLLLEDDEDLRIFREVTERYETREFLFVTFTPREDLFSDTSLAQIRNMRAEFRKLERVESVTTLIDVPLVEQIPGKLSDVASNKRTLEDGDVDRENARKELLNSPIFSNLIISKDGQTTALQINLKNDDTYRELQNRKNRLLLKRRDGSLDRDEKLLLEQTIADYDLAKIRLDRLNHENIASVRAIMDKYRDYGTLHLGGVPMIADDMITFVKSDLVIFGAGVFLFLVCVLAFIFRELRWVVLPLLSCVYAVVLMIGLLGLVGWRVTVISSNFISLMLIITISMNIHLVVRYRQLRKDMPELEQRELVLLSARKMVWPCLYTALTTIMAFCSLVFCDIKPVIDFGWMMTIGLTVTFLTSFLLFPVLLVMMPKSGLKDIQENQFRFTSRLAAFTQKHGVLVLSVSAAMAVISAIGITRLEVENSFINYFSDDTEIYQGLKLIDDKLGGTSPLDIVLTFPEHEESPGPGEEDDFDDLSALFGDIETSKEDMWFTPAKLDVVKEVHDYLDGLPAVGKVLSLASIIRVGEDINKGDFDAFELAIVYKRMPKELKSSMIDPYISIEKDEARINMRILDSLKELRRKELLQQIHADLVEKLGLEEKNIKITGLMVLYNNMLQSLFRSQILTLGVVMAGIAIMLLLLFRSVSLATIGIIPNLLAAASILGLMGLMKIPLDMMTITIASITIGIAVDNSIHYIYRFREEFPKFGDYERTMHYCHANIGNAVFYTATTIIVGFSILVLSNFIPTIYFGILTALAMFIALMAALTLLPKLILVWKPFPRP